MAGFRFSRNLPELLSTVKAKKCGCCGHHEIVAVKSDGTEIPLKPGTKIILYDVKEDEDNEHSS